MMDRIATSAEAAWQGLCGLGRGVRRGIVAVCAAVAMIVIYTVTSIGSYGLTVAGASGVMLVSSTTKADAWRRRRHRHRGWHWRRRRRGLWFYFGPRRRRRRRWRRRRHRGIHFYW